MPYNLTYSGHNSDVRDFGLDPCILELDDPYNILTESVEAVRLVR